MEEAGRADDKDAHRSQLTWDEPASLACFDGFAQSDEQPDSGDRLVCMSSNTYIQVYIRLCGLAETHGMCK